MRFGRFIFGPACFGWIGLSLVPIQARDLSGLEKNNPFGAGIIVEKPSEQAAQWELRGVIRESGGYLLNIYDAQTKKSVWVREGEAGRALLVHGFSQADGTVVAEFGGRNFSLAIKSYRDGTPRPTVAALAAISGIPVKAPAVLAAVAPPQTEVRRLESVAQEVRMRRELRQKSTPGNPQT